jgi:hypothetical protein
MLTLATGGSHGGFGQKRLDKCDATKSKSGKHRNFHDSCEFIQVVRHMLNTQTFGDGEDAEDRHLTEVEVDRIIAEAAAPVETEAWLVCGSCRNRVVAACLQLAQQLATDWMQPTVGPLVSSRRPSFFRTILPPAARAARRRPSHHPSWRWAGCHLPTLLRDRPRPDQIYQTEAGEHLSLVAVDRQLQHHRRARARPHRPHHCRRVPLCQRHSRRWRRSRPLSGRLAPSFRR